MRRSVVGGLAAMSLVAVGLTVGSNPASAVRPAADPVTVVQIAVANGQATVSPTEITPGIVEFQVTKNFVVPGKDGGPEAVSVIQTDQLDTFFATLPAVFSGDPAKPKTLAAAAQGMRTINSIVTAYGGATKGMSWQVRLPAGSYTVLGIQSATMGKTKPASFTVAGTPRVGALPAAQGVISAVGPVGKNKFVASNLSRFSDGWLRFSNRAHEIHFLDMTGVKPDTTKGMVRKVFAGTGSDAFFTGPNIGFDVISPGVAVTIKWPDPIPAGRYLVDCFIPSETDGMPHAVMGMWKLVNVG